MNRFWLGSEGLKGCVHPFTAGGQDEGLALWELFPPLKGKCHFILSYRSGEGTLHAMFC